MGITIDPNPVELFGTPTIPNAPDGYAITGGWADARLYAIPTGQIVNTYQLDFVSPQNLDGTEFWQFFNSQLWNIQQNLGQDVLGWVLYKGAEHDVSIPIQQSLGEYEWTPPYQGEEVQSIIGYRLWIVSEDYVQASAHAVRAWSVIEVGIVAIILLVVFAAVMSYREGKITWSQVDETITKILTSPGENLNKGLGGLTGPFIAFGVAVIAAGVFIPYINAQASATLPIGPGSVSVGGGLGSSGGGKRK